MIFQKAKAIEKFPAKILIDELVRGISAAGLFVGKSLLGAHLRLE